MKSKNREKFTDFNELLNAYENLQAEFTRRCQRLKALEEEREREKVSEKAKEGEEAIERLDEAAIERLKERDGVAKEDVPDVKEVVVVEKEVELDASGDSGTEATETESHVEEATEEALCQETEAQRDAEYASDKEKEKVVEQARFGDSAHVGYNGVSPQQTNIDEQIAQRLADPKFVDEVIMTNSEITSRIIAAYLTSLAGTGNVTTIKSGAGSMYFSPIRRPKSLAEARALAEKLLE